MLRRVCQLIATVGLLSSTGCGLLCDRYCDRQNCNNRCAPSNCCNYPQGDNCAPAPGVYPANSNSNCR